MANLTLSPIWEAAIYQLATDDPVLGGAGGISNLHAQQLGNRSEWLKEKLDNAGIVDALEFTGDLATLKTPGAYIVLNASTNKPATGNGVCFVVAKASVAAGPNHYVHYYVDQTNAIHVRTYINDAAVGNWETGLKKSVYDAQQLVEVGQLSMFYGTAPRAGWLNCIGGIAVSRTTYADLFAMIGTTYGSGNGTTTFNLPDLENSPASPSGSGGFSWYIKT